MKFFDTIGEILGKTGVVVLQAGKLILTVLRTVKKIRRGPKKRNKEANIGLQKSTQR